VIRPAKISPTSVMAVVIEVEYIDAERVLSSVTVYVGVLREKWLDLGVKFTSSAGVKTLSVLQWLPHVV